ncbi:hypothetical protein FRC10_002156 [Ceratobasidium sp. 414]|nr:hypothetical protein FRC10_002156 [Ceratobasidium sp. 414]
MSAHSKFIGEGAALLETVTRAAANPSGSLENSPLDKITVDDGFYRIVQYEDGTELNASFPTDVSVSPPEFQVGMSSTPEAVDQSWMFTHQWGVKYGFTIVPKNFPTDPKSQFGATAVNDGMYATVKGSGCYPVWKVRCDEARTYR